MDEAVQSAHVPLPEPAPESGNTVAPEPRRVASLIEVLVCSGFPTQFAVMVVLATFGLRPQNADGDLSLRFFGLLAGLDSVLLVSLIFFFLLRRGESPRTLLLGARPVAREAALGAALIPIVFVFVALVVGGLRLIAPWLQTVPQNPLGALLDTRFEAIVFAFIVVIAGGLREEIQRAFILHRFEQSLGGVVLGLALFSVMFGVGHLEQGADVAITTGALGLFWGLLYLARRSFVAASVSHAGFNLAQVIVQASLLGRHLGAS